MVEAGGYPNIHPTDSRDINVTQLSQIVKEITSIYHKENELQAFYQFISEAMSKVIARNFELGPAEYINIKHIYQILDHTPPKIELKNDTLNNFILYEQIIFENIYEKLLLFLKTGDTLIINHYFYYMYRYPKLQDIVQQNFSKIVRLKLDQKYIDLFHVELLDISKRKLTQCTCEIKKIFKLFQLDCDSENNCDERI